MADQYKHLVNKQYNSPIHLYSDRNVKEILQKETQILSNGAVGIDFNNPMTGKPASLQNSAVLRMLEEEENRKRTGQPGSIANDNSKPLRDQISWPPAPSNEKHHASFHDVTESGTVSGVKRVAWPPPEDESYVEQAPVQAQGGPVYPSQNSGIQSTNQNPQNIQQNPGTQPPTNQGYQTPINQGYQPANQGYQAPINQGYQAPTNQGCQQPALKVSTNPSGQQQQPRPSSLSSGFQPISPGQQSPGVSNKSPVSFTIGAKPWSPQASPSATPGFKSVQAPQFSSVKSYQSSKTTEYSTRQQYQYSTESSSASREAQQPALQVYSSSKQESSFSQQYPSPGIKETQPSFTQFGSPSAQSQKQASSPAPHTFSPSAQSFAPSAQSFTPSAQSFTPASPAFKPSSPVFTPAPAPVFREQKVSEEPQHKNIVEKILSVKLETVDPDVQPEIITSSGVKPSRKDLPEIYQRPQTPQVQQPQAPQPQIQQPQAPQPQVQQPQVRPVQAPQTQVQPKPVERTIPVQREQVPVVPKPATPVQQPSQPPLYTSQVSLTKSIPKPVENIIPIQTEPVSNQHSTAQSAGTQQQGTQNQPPQNYQTYTKPVKAVEPPPSIITLRSKAPVSQAPPPLVTSQPATAAIRGGKHLRGDLKWPPEDVREKMEAEKQHLEELSKGPACRPRKNCKDYTPFFAKHMLPNTYPGYKIPPGTQFYDHNPVM